MSPNAILAAMGITAALTVGTCGVVAVRRWWIGVNAEREAASRRMIDLRDRIVDDHEMIRAGGRRPHGSRFTLHPERPMHKKAIHVSSTGERSENRG